jgi:hypothetical protein
VRRRGIDLTVGLGLLLGPLIYALTLEPAPAPVCVGPTDESAAAAQPREEPPRPTPVAVEVELVEVEAAPEPVAHRAPFLFVTDAGVVLSSEAEHAWGVGRLFEPKGEVSYRAAKRANPKTVPSELWSMRGRTLDLYGPDGRVCTARLGELRVVAQYGGYSLGGVLGEDWFEVDPERATKTQIREGLWERDDLWLVAEIESRDTCKGALWARDAELPPPAILRGSSAPNRASEARLAAFAKSEELAETERNYRAEYAAVEAEVREYIPSWATLVAEHGASVQSWLDASGHPRLIHLDFGLESGGCGDPFVSSIKALEYVRGEEFDAVPNQMQPPAAVFDADFDGQLELLHSGTDGYHWLSSATLGASLTIDEDWVCPC